MSSRSILLTLNDSCSDQQAIQAVESLWDEKFETVVLVWLVPPQSVGGRAAGSSSIIGPQVTAYERLSRLSKSLRARGIAVRIQIRTGDPREELVKAAAEVEADLIAVPAFAEPTPRPRLEEIAESASKETGRPVLVVPRDMVSADDAVLSEPPIEQRAAVFGH